MEDKWRIFFTIPIIILLLVGFLVFGILGLIGFYLWTGFLIYMGCEFNYPKLILFWLPALWIESVREYVT